MKVSMDLRCIAPFGIFEYINQTPTTDTYLSSPCIKSYEKNFLSSQKLNFKIGVKDTYNYLVETVNNVTVFHR